MSCCVRPAAHLSLSSIASLTGYTISASQASESAHGSAQVTSGSGATSPYPSGTSLTITITPNTGYEFEYLKVNGSTVTTTASGNSRTYTFSITQNTTYEYAFTPIKYAVTVSKTGSGTITPSSNTTADYDSTITFAATAATGYTFTNWVIVNNGTSQTYTTSSVNITVKGAITATATFTINKYTITTAVASGGGGSVSAGGTYNYNTSISLTATPNDHYQFVSWTISTGGTSTANPVTFNATANVTYTANFALKKYTLTIQSNNIAYGTVTNAMSNSSQNALSSFTSNATAMNGYRFVGWIDSAGVTVTTSNLLEITLTQNSIYTAVFERSDINARATVGGEVRMGGYDIDDLSGTIHFSAVAYKGYQFLGWYVGDTQIVDASKMSVDLNIQDILGKTIVAKFALISSSNLNDDLNN